MILKIDSKNPQHHLSIKAKRITPRG